MQVRENKFDVGNFVTVELAQKLYEEFGIATIVTDGRYVQIEKEPTTGQSE